MWEIIYAKGVAADLARVGTFNKTTIIDMIERVLSDKPFVEVGKRKDLHVSADDGKPLWQLAVGDYRVFYVAEAPQVVAVRAVRHKGRKTTGEIL